ncbi:MAG TPA: type II glyceraldehyde-3-phosphate dehydrogenase, partial [Marine Group III euryarchaeote]|nr:type II glyceraldehyde-3-phosphate dehydrogenase [Marine Group III euryarchaeote]
MEMYKNGNTKAIWQGGEKHALIGVSFNALTNYSESIGKDFVRVVSCNTTGLARTLYPISQNYGIDNVQAVMVRRSGDPKDSDRGPLNSIEPVLNVPSHHGPDVQTVISDLNIQTMAVKVPTTIMHVHCIIAKLNKKPNVKDVLSIWESTPRVNLLDGFLKNGETKIRNLPGTAEIMELARDLSYRRGDLNQIAVWRDGVHALDDKLYYYQAIHQESDVVPENIDAIRAMFSLESDNMKSIHKTNKALGIN